MFTYSDWIFSSLTRKFLKGESNKREKADPQLAKSFCTFFYYRNLKRWKEERRKKSDNGDFWSLSDSDEWRNLRYCTVPTRKEEGTNPLRLKRPKGDDEKVCHALLFANSRVGLPWKFAQYCSIVLLYCGCIRSTRYVSHFVLSVKFAPSSVSAVIHDGHRHPSREGRGEHVLCRYVLGRAGGQGVPPELSRTNVLCPGENLTEQQSTFTTRILPICKTTMTWVLPTWIICSLSLANWGCMTRRYIILGAVQATGRISCNSVYVTTYEKWGIISKRKLVTSRKKLGNRITCASFHSTKAKYSYIRRYFHNLRFLKCVF